MKGYDKVIGRNAVREALKSGRNINKIFISENHDSGLVNVIKEAKSKGISIQKTNKHKMDNMVQNAIHQGIIALCSPIEYSSIEDILSVAKEKGENPLIVILENITDPHNAGAIARSAYCAGAHGVVIAKRRSVSISEGMYKASAGAIEHIKICEVSNIAQTIEKLKKEGVFIVGLDTSGESYEKIDYKLPIALVVGAEGTGIGRLVKEKCDYISTIGFKNDFDSLNASVAAGIVLFESLRQRG